MFTRGYQHDLAYYSFPIDSDHDSDVTGPTRAASAMDRGMSLFGRKVSCLFSTCHWDAVKHEVRLSVSQVKIHGDLLAGFEHFLVSLIFGMICTFFSNILNISYFPYFPWWLFDWLGIEKTTTNQKSMVMAGPCWAAINVNSQNPCSKDGFFPSGCEPTIVAISKQGHSWLIGVYSG